MLIGPFPRLFLAGLAIFSASTAIASKKPPELLAKAAPWQMNYASGSCNLIGTFATGPDQVLARFTKTDTSGRLRLQLYGKRFGRVTGVHAPASVYFLPTATIPPRDEVSLGSTTLRGEKLPMVFVRSIWFDAGNSSLAARSLYEPVSDKRIREVHGLHVEMQGLKPFVLDLQSMAPPMAAMDKCTNDLVSTWGFDPAELATRVTRPTPTESPNNWIRPSDYPPAMLLAGQSAIISFRLMVNADGSVSECHVQDGTNPPKIGPYSCDLIKQRARFLPARDRKGVLVPDYYINHIFWKNG